jgi:hypothetical protein
LINGRSNGLGTRWGRLRLKGLIWCLVASVTDRIITMRSWSDWCGRWWSLSNLNYLSSLVHRFEKGFVEFWGNRRLLRRWSWWGKRAFWADKIIVTSSENSSCFTFLIGIFVIVPILLRFDDPARS